MKRLFRTSLPFILIPSLFIACNSKDSTDGNVDTQDATITTPPLENTEKSEMNQIVAEERSEYRGNLIVEYNNIKVYADYGLSEDDSKYGDDITAKDETYLIRYVDELPMDTMVLKGPYNSLLGKNRLCNITVGTDTVSVGISTPFNKYLDIRFTGVLPGCQFYRYSKHYTLSERSFPTDFQINIAIQDDAPAYIRNYINETIRDDVARYFGDYSGDKTIYPHVPLFNIEDGDFNQLSRYYYTQFCRLYKNENSDESDPEEIPLGPHYSYQFYAYPIWESSDTALITWKFYDYCYLGGAHGGETEYFLTFDNNTGKILGVDDFYTNNEFNKAIDLLRCQLNAFHNRGVSNEYSYSADLDVDSNVTAVQSTILNEVVGGKLYPRPALTRQGVVFTYQTYEKGSNADGILHFIQPYDNDLKLKPHTELILNEDEELSEWAEELGDCQHGENARSYVLVDKARVAVNRKYNDIIEQDSTYRNVYDRWSDMMESMCGYLVDVTYGEPFYSLQPLQFNHDIRQWYETMLREVEIDKNIICGDTIYTSSIKHCVTPRDIDGFFYQFKPTKPGGYHRMWNDIKPDFFEWRIARDKYAEDLAPQKRLSYEEHTSVLTYYLFKEIKGLLISRNDNIK